MPSRIILLSSQELSPTHPALFHSVHWSFSPPSLSLFHPSSHSFTQVALTALEFWQDTYVTTLQGLASDARQPAIASHTSLLQVSGDVIYRFFFIMIIVRPTVPAGPIVVPHLA